MSKIQIQFNLPNIGIDENPNAYLFFHDLNCVRDVNLSKLDSRYFGHPYRWIILNTFSVQKEELIGSELRSINALIDSNIILVTQINSTTYNLDQCKIILYFFFVFNHDLIFDFNRLIVIYIEWNTVESVPRK